MRSALVAAALAASLSLSACASPSADENVRALATLEHYGDPVRVDTPAEVSRGVAFRVTAVAYGGGCIAKGETDTRIEGLEAVITPYEYDRSAALRFCTDELRLYEHEATIRFDTPGDAVVVVRGQRKPSREVITVRRTVVVK